MLNYKLKTARDYLDEPYQMRMHEPGYTQSDMEEPDRTANENGNYVVSSTGRAYYRDQYKGVQSYQGGGSDTVKTEEQRECNVFLSNRGHVNKQSSVSDVEKWSSWPSRTWSLS